MTPRPQETEERMAIGPELATVVYNGSGAGVDMHFAPHLTEKEIQGIKSALMWSLAREVKGWDCRHMYAGSLVDG